MQESTNKMELLASMHVLRNSQHAVMGVELARVIHYIKGTHSSQYKSFSQVEWIKSD